MPTDPPPGETGNFILNMRLKEIVQFEEHSQDKIQSISGRIVLKNIRIFGLSFCVWYSFVQAT